ncbi:Uncharacterized protein PECH_003471 [Penicillium ucsense]|uniref:Oxidoreductase n=1 Tax=Penicillium ucsense TaxID=2839758 RepID=A0A8J8VW02_9EURO|nr:Uncharacterized protein PECM_002951 [Penicillium ucsense]KAF7737555.1 Uncharacterized protein PECH_003471 [Penicillium ucsense]
MSSSSTTLFPGVAVVTGAGGTGIGAAVVRAFAAAGCERIAITDVNETTLEQTKAAISATYPRSQVFVHPGNITDDQFAENFIRKVVENFGRVDYAVNCAGVLGQAVRSSEMSIDEFDRVNNINYRGCWLSSRAQLKQMLKQDALASHDPERPAQRGAIVNIASQLGLVSRPAAPAYCASKAAIIGMTRSDAVDHSQDGIRVNCVCPGVIETPMITGDPAVLEAIGPAVDIAPMKRMGKPAEVADAVLFLCSTHASFVQGHALGVDGGYLIV